MAKRTTPAPEPTPKSGARSSVPPGDGVPPRTLTLPDAQRGPWFDAPDVVTMLRVYGADLEFELPRDAKTFSIGSLPERDIAIPGEFLSGLHCVVERRGPAVRVHDQGSHNGTFFRGRRESTFDLRPGDTFTAASIRFLAMNDQMRTSYPVLADIMGAEGERAIRSSGDVVSTPSDLIVAATEGANMLITAEPDCDQDRLARVIHAISLRRDRSIVEIDRVPQDRGQQREILERAARSTLVLTIDPKSSVMDSTFCSMLFSSSYHVRVIALAPTVSKAGDVLGGATVTPMQHVWLRPLAQRGGAIHYLLDRMLMERGATLRASELSAENQLALRAYSWPDNFAGLRLAADRLVAIARDGSLRKAAEALGVSQSTFNYWFNQIGLSMPLAR